MSLFKRLMTWGKSEANAALDELENPIKMAEQGIRDLRKDLTDSMQGLAKVKSQVIQTRRETNRNKEAAADYERKAMLLLQKVQQGTLSADEADRLATEALSKRDAAVQRATTLSAELENLNRMTGQLENNITALKHQISKWENELYTLKARSQVSTATRKLNEQLAKVDSSGTVSMLERMRAKVESEESLAEAYGEMAMVENSVDTDIDRALAGTPTASPALADLKARMGVPMALPEK